MLRRTIGFKTEFNENTRAWMGCYEPVGIMEPSTLLHSPQCFGQQLNPMLALCVRCVSGFHDPDVPAEPGVIYDGGALPFNRLVRICDPCFDAC